MPAQIPIDRKSLDTTLDGRYENQRVGGAFNAKDLPKNNKIDLAERYLVQHVGGAYDAKNVREQPIDFGQQDKTFETPDTFLGDNFNEKALNFAKSTGHTSKKYKP